MRCATAHRETRLHLLQQMPTSPHQPFFSLNTVRSNPQPPHLPPPFASPPFLSPPPPPSPPLAYAPKPSPYLRFSITPRPQHPPRNTPTKKAKTKMALFKSIGNVFKRPDDRLSFDHPDTHPPPQSLLPINLSAKLLGTSPHTPLDESPDLYYEDRPLGHSIHALEEVRLALRELTNAANEHKDMLIASANAERALGDTLADVMNPASHPNDDHSDDGDDEFDDLAVGHSVRDGNKHPRRDENFPPTHFSNYLPLEAREAQKALGRGLVSHSDATVKLSVVLSSPINELTTSFEERYNRKIVPLRRRYIDQKGQYLKYKRNADMAESDEKRSYYEALAEAAKPVWMRTSTELRTESEVMTEVTAKNMAKWSRSVALHHERALAIAAANFADAFNRAKTLPTLSRSHPN